MNVLITLPKKRITAIVEGRKTIIFKKTFPRRFSTRTDVVLICESGTNLVVAWFKVATFQYESDPVVVWDLYKNKLCVPFLWFMTYARGYRPYYLWHVESAGYLPRPFLRDATFELSENPRDFAYTERNFVVFPTILD